MNRDEARQEIRASWRELLQDITIPAKQKANGETSFVCPICGHGKGGDGLTRNPKSRDGNTLRCFGCDFSGDIIDLYQKATGLDHNGALSALAERRGITIDPYKPTERPTGRAEAAGGINTLPEPKSPQNANKTAFEPPADYRAYYRECRSRIDDTEAISYLSARGIRRQTAVDYWVGFDPGADPATNPGGTGRSRYPSPRLIFPCSESHYVARSIDPDIEPKYAKMNPPGEIALFNSKALYAQDVQFVFVVEGVFDALSIIQSGEAAIALNSTSNARKLIEQLEAKRTNATLILCLDNDGKPGTAKALQILQDGLKRLNIGHITANICGKYKDANEAFVANIGEFVSTLKGVKYEAGARPENTKYYIDHLMAADIEKFKHYKATGFPNLDYKARGLYAGLYCIAAISSLGKTTFAAQMADQIAEAGNDVLFFSLEQSRLEMVSKSIARTAAQMDSNQYTTSLQIRSGFVTQTVLQAAEAYKEKVGERVSIIEGNFGCNVSFIGDYVRKYIERNRTRPVVFIDYLQILQGDQQNGKQSTKEMVDSTVTELKRLSRELELIIFIISSVNRANYLTPIDFESLKESGGIEYTCDVIWGLQLQCLNEPIFEKDKNIKERRERVKQAKAENPRKIELSCLKNRFGVASFSCFFDYYPANDLFVPSEPAGENPFDPADRKPIKRL